MEGQTVGFHLENKLCKVGSMFRSQGQNVTCPDFERCSATLREVDLISENAVGKYIGHSFAKDNVAIRLLAECISFSWSTECYASSPHRKTG